MDVTPCAVPASTRTTAEIGAELTRVERRCNKRLAHLLQVENATGASIATTLLENVKVLRRILDALERF